MNKKILIILAVILVVAAIGVVLFMVLGNNESAKTLDVEAANQTLSNSEPFNKMAMMDITTQELSTVYGINSENVEKVYGKMPMMNVQASMYLLIEAKQGTVDTVKAELDAYATRYEEQWSRYLPEQYDLVQNRKVAVVGNSIYMIISENAETLEQEITK